MALSYINAYSSTADSNSYTFAGASLGTASADRYIIVPIHSRKTGATTTISTVTIGGVAATIVRQKTNTSVNTNLIGLAIALVPTGTTGDIVVTFADTMLRCAVGVYRATEVRSITASDTDDSVVADPTANLDIPIGFAISAGTSATSPTWTGLTEDYDSLIESFMNVAGAHDSFSTPQTGRTITLDYGAESEPVAVFASWAVISAPFVSILSATNVLAYTATIRGEITDTGGESNTEVGFEWGEVSGAYEHSVTLTSGSPYTGIVSHNLTSLNEGQTYYYRFYSKNAHGTTYTGEFMFTTIDSAYSITIDGIERSTDILINSLVVEDIINDQQNNCNFAMIDRAGLGVPQTDDEIIITMLDGTKLFGGYITNVNLSKLETGTILIEVECVDYSRLLDSILVHKAYEGNTDKEIIEDIVDTYLPGYGITYTNVLEGVTIDQISFNYKQPSQAFRRIAELSSRFWYIDYDKDLHYFPLATNEAPFNITSASNNYIDLKVGKDASQLKNRVYVRGGTKLSDPTTYNEKGDGEKNKFVLPDKPHNVSVSVNGSPQTLGIKNIDTEGFDWYLNFQEKYLEQDAGGVILTDSDVLEVEYEYDIPILVALENVDSIAASGVKEHAIFDTSIKTTEAARERASAELTDYANSLIEGSFNTYIPGFRSGQYININLSEYGINDDYMVQAVRATSLGAGNYVYEVSIASAKTLGIIRFLIDLLETNRNLIELSNEEVVDELFNISDSLLTDSLVENLTIDSQGAYFTWCTDSLQSTPITRAVWDLFSWG